MRAALEFGGVVPEANESLAEAFGRLLGILEDEFQKNVAKQKTHGKVMETKFDELLRQAKESPDKAPPKRDFDLD